MWAKPIYKAAGVSLPDPMRRVLSLGREIFPTAKPQGELVPYVGEAIDKLRHGYDLFLNVAPEGCMVSSMGEVAADAIYRKSSKLMKPNARLQGLFSLDGEVDVQRLNLALLKLSGPGGYYQK